MATETLQSQLSQLERNRLQQLLGEKGRRADEGLRRYRPMPSQVPFHHSKASEKVLRGGVRSGKTTALAAEVASAATGTPLLDPDGNELPFLYPKNRPLLIWVIGYDEKHIGRIHRKLFRPGLFKIIKDKETGEMRAWRPWEEADLAREDETVQSEPLIPERFIKETSWENKGERAFTVCRLQNDTEIHAFPSGAEAGQGEAVDIIWIDEDIKYPKHLDEWLSRLSDVRGKLLWSVWPHSANDGLINMSRRAEEQSSLDEPDVYEQVLKFSDNPYIPRDEKRKRIAAWGPTVSRSRDKGEFLTDTVLVFPTFHIDIHGVGGTACPRDIEVALRDNAMMPPWRWTNYLVLDPGHTQPALIMATIPPPEFGDHVVIFDEIYIPTSDATDMAKEVTRKAGNVTWQAFIIDPRSGRRTPEGFSITVKKNYSDKFQAERITSTDTGVEFIPGSDNIGARNMLVRDWLAVRENGSSKLLIVGEATSAMQREFCLYKKKVTRNSGVVSNHQSRPNPRPTNSATVAANSNAVARASPKAVLA